MLERVDEAVWLVEGDIVSFYGFSYPTCSVIIRLTDGRLWVWSPVRLTEDVRRDVDVLGQVALLVSPNKLHHFGLVVWSSVYPAAKLWGPTSTIRRFPSLTFAGALEDAAPLEWGSDIEQAWFRGSYMMDEIVFVHRPSRTAIVADLIQAFDEAFLQRHWSWWRRPWRSSAASPPRIPARRAPGGAHLSAARPPVPPGSKS